MYCHSLLLMARSWLHWYDARCSETRYFGDSTGFGLLWRLSSQHEFRGPHFAKMAWIPPSKDDGFILHRIPHPGICEHLSALKTHWMQLELCSHGSAPQFTTSQSLLSTRTCMEATVGWDLFTSCAPCYRRGIYASCVLTLCSNRFNPPICRSGFLVDNVRDDQRQFQPHMQCNRAHLECVKIVVFTWYYFWKDLEGINQE